MTLSYTYTQIDGVKHRRIYPYSILIKSYSIPTLIRSSTWGHRNVEFALVFIRRFKCRFDVEPTTEKSTASYFLFLFCPFGQTYRPLCAFGAMFRRINMREKEKNGRHFQSSFSISFHFGIQQVQVLSLFSHRVKSN